MAKRTIHKAGYKGAKGRVTRYVSRLIAYLILFRRYIFLMRPGRERYDLQPGTLVSLDQP